MKTYNADSIEYLEGLEQIRKRPDMYMGGTTGQYPPALYRMIREVIDNSVDEYLGGYCNTIRILIDRERCEFTIIDNGRGIPTDINTRSGKSALTLVFTKLHAGGKFTVGDNYKVSAGKNGIGLKGTNALSDRLIVWSNNNKKKNWVGQEFIRGIPSTDKPLDLKIPDYLESYIPKTGTIIQYVPDPTIFKDGIKLDSNRLFREVNDIQYLCPKLRLDIIEDGKCTSFYSDQGILELVKTDNVEDEPFYYTSSEMDVALNFTSRDNSTFRSYVNTCYTDMGGTHLNGLKKAIVEVIRSHSKKKLQIDDVLEGVIGVIHYRMSEPEYQGQTKNELTSNAPEKIVHDTMTIELERYFRKHKSTLERIIKYSEMMADKRDKMKAERDLLKGIRAINNSAKYISDKFLDADRRKFRDMSNLEMFVVEGDSAGGHFIKAREGFQACLKLRGKIINAAKASDADLFGSSKKGSEKDGNREIKDLTAALGCGVLDQYNERNLRFGKLIIMTDKDDDGSHITNLVLAFLIKYMPDLIKNGHVYTIDAPLFLANGPSFRVYGMSRNEVEKKMRDQKCKQYTITRLKGWGECDADDLANLCVSPKTRKLIQMKWDDSTIKTLEQTMAGDSEFRKILLDVK